jgi:uncharacterized BrkB/YihY/UPF0761 family membrane protein
MAKMKRFGKIRGWFLKEPYTVYPVMQTKSSELFSKKFWQIYVISYGSFLLAIALLHFFNVLPFDFLVRGLGAIVFGMVITVVVWLLYRLDPQVRLKVGYVFVGAWLGYAIVFLAGLPLLRGADFSVILLLFITIPTIGGLIGYWLQKRKFSNVATEEMKK